MVLPTGLVSPELRYKYFCTIMLTVEARMADMPQDQLVLCLEQFIPHLLDDMKDFLLPETREHVEFIVSCLRVLIGVNSTAHKFEIHRYVVFALEAGAQVTSPQLRKRIVQSVVESKLLTTRFAKHWYCIFKIVELGLEECFPLHDKVVLPSRPQSYLVQFLHIGIEIMNELLMDTIPTICAAICKYCSI